MKSLIITILPLLLGCTSIVEGLAYSRVSKEMKESELKFYIREKYEGYNYYEPESVVSDRVVVFIHGGGWSKGTPEEYEFFAKYINDLGLRCIFIRYPLLTEAGIEDINRSILTTFTTLNYNNFLIGGNSAGAQLVFSLYNRLEDRYKERVNGIFSISGVLDLSSSSSPILNSLVDKAFREDEKLINSENPIRSLKRGELPIYLIHSTKDGVVPIKGIMNFKTVATEKGYKLDYLEFNNFLHDESYYYPFIRKDPRLREFNSWLTNK